MARRILVLTLLLTGFGLVMISSAGIYVSQKAFQSHYGYFINQLLRGVLPGLAVFFILSRIDYRRWRKLSLLFLGVALGFLILVLMPGFGISVKGATRWLDVRYFSFQPSEFFKLGFIIYLAAWLNGRVKSRIVDFGSLMPLTAVLVVAGIILLLQPDLGTGVIIALIMFGMLFLAGLPWRHIALALVGGGLIVLGLSIFAPYRLQRVITFINPAKDVEGASYHLNQSLTAIGSGGLLGVGFGNSQQKLGFLPEPVTDSIFAIIGEELGLVGMLGVIGLVGFLVLSLFSLGRRTKDPFGSFLVGGIASWIGAQSIINICAVSGLLPFTGITLPFVSYGGTSLVALLAAMGIAFNIAKDFEAKRRKVP